MKNLLLILIALTAVNLYSQRIARSSIGCLGSTSKGIVSLLAATGISSPVSSPTILSSNRSIQTRPFIFASGKSGNNFQVKVFPNPTSNWIEIRSTGTIRETKVFDVANRLCYSGNLNRVNLESYTVGIYSVTVLLEDNSTYCEKIILNK
jgi:hypothetical protein